ncbi:hypothetical protein C2G38_2028000 [Gigaspora rosea]|uniref:Uncharacterized protein n=1 Tax=Gigaspora rosea TaxID=44941 RepID=A0A397W4V9_9GLOM|nr:hypothetical protein C2G38_2028000 [Gigaspora rosea]
MKYNDAEFADLTFTESKEFLQITFFDKKNVQKELYIKLTPYGCREPIECSILVNGFEVKDYILKDNYINKRISTMDDVFSIMRFCRKSSICMGQYTKAHASKEILTELVQNMRKTLKSQKELVKELRDLLKQKFEMEEENTSEPLANIVHNVVEEVKNQHEDISNIVLKELIHIQSGKPKGIRYHPMFIRWAISIYSTGPSATKL